MMKLFQNNTQNKRWHAIVPILCSFVAFILSFLILFAGNKPGFLEDYSLITVNTSAIGQGFIDDLLPGSDSSPSENSTNTNDSGDGGFLDSLGDLASDASDRLGDLADQAGDKINGALDSLLESTSAKLGIDEWYSAHLLNYCEGSYTPTNMPNASIPLSTITRNVTNCTAPASFFSFNPRAAIEQKLGESDFAREHNITLDKLHWPSAIDDAAATIRTAYYAIFVFFILTIALSLLGTLSSLAALLLGETWRKLLTFANIGIVGLAFFCSFLSSAVITAVINIAGDTINNAGEAVSIEAKKGTKIMTLSWVTMTLLFVGMATWVADLFWTRRRAKAGMGGAGKEFQ